MLVTAALHISMLHATHYISLSSHLALRCLKHFQKSSSTQHPQEVIQFQERLQKMQPQSAPRASMDLPSRQAVATQRTEKNDFAPSKTLPYLELLATAKDLGIIFKESTFSTPERHTHVITAVTQLHSRIEQLVQHTLVHRSAQFSDVFQSAVNLLRSLKKDEMLPSRFATLSTLRRLE